MCLQQQVTGSKRRWEPQGKSKEGVHGLNVLQTLFYSSIHISTCLSCSSPARLRLTQRVCWAHGDGKSCCFVTPPLGAGRTGVMLSARRERVRGRLLTILAAKHSGSIMQLLVSSVISSLAGLGDSDKPLYSSTYTVSLAMKIKEAMTHVWKG